MSPPARGNVVSTTAEYALRIMVALGGAAGEPLTSETIGDRTRVSREYVYKVLRRLAQAGFVHGRRGRFGGYHITCDPHHITVFDIVRVIDPLSQTISCPNRRPEHAGLLCALHECLRCTSVVLHEELHSYTLADLLETDDSAIDAFDDEPMELTIVGGPRMGAPTRWSPASRWRG